MDEMIGQLAITIAVQLTKGDLGGHDHNRASADMRADSMSGKVETMIPE